MRTSVMLLYPDWLDKEAWDAWLEARKKIRAPLTDRAAKMWLEDLAEWHEAGYDTRYILRESAKKDWRGLFLTERTPKRVQQKPFVVEPLSPQLQAAIKQIDEAEKGAKQRFIEGYVRHHKRPA